MSKRVMTRMIVHVNTTDDNGRASDSKAWMQEDDGQQESGSG